MMVKYVFCSMFLMIVTWAMVPFAQAQTPIFADNFEDSTLATAPSDTPQVGSWSDVGAGAAPVVDNTITIDSVDPGGNGGSIQFLRTTLENLPFYPDTYQGVGTFTTPAFNGTSLHLELFAYSATIPGFTAFSQFQFGFGVNGSTFGPQINVNKDGSVEAVAGGTQDTPLTHLFDTWEKYELDVVLGSQDYTLTVGGNSSVITGGAAAFSGASDFVQGMFVWAGGSDVLTFVDDVLVTIDIPGDFDTDLDVDGADFLFWQRNLGDAASLALWEANYGYDTVSAVSAVTAAVPEPGSLALVFLAFGSLLSFAGKTRPKQKGGTI